MADAERYDIYWGRGADKVFEEALEFVETNTPPPFPQGSFIEVSPHGRAYTLVIFFTLATDFDLSDPTFSLNEYELCKEQAMHKNTDGIQYCKKIARTMQERSNSAKSRLMGFSIEKAMLEITEPDNPKIHAIGRLKEAHKVMIMCCSQLWTNHVDQWPSVEEVRWKRLFKNEDQLGEWEGRRLTLEQEYVESPENFIVSPTECNTLLEMDDAQLSQFMGGGSALEVWEQMQADAKAKSQE